MDSYIDWRDVQNGYIINALEKTLIFNKQLTCWDHSDRGISVTAASTLGPHQTLWLQLSNKINLLYRGTSWHENLTSPDLLFPPKSLKKQVYALVDKADVCNPESPLTQQKSPAFHNALHLKSGATGARWTAPIWHLTAFIFLLFFW